MAYELDKRGLSIERQRALSVFYDDIKFEHGFRADIIVESKVIIEIKSVELLHPLHFKQLHTYLKIANIRDGILVNFNADLIKEGFHRLFNNYVH